MLLLSAITFDYTEAYSETCQIYKMELFAKTVASFQRLTLSARGSVLDVWQGIEYASVTCCGAETKIL